MKKRFFKIAKWFFGIVLGIFLLISGVLYFFKDEICGIVVSEVNKHLNLVRYLFFLQVEWTY